jgi:rubrerythrin
MSDITLALNAFKFVRESLTTIRELKIDSATMLRVVEAQEQLMKAQEQLYAMREELFRYQDKARELETSLASSKQWEDSLSSYELVTTSTSGVVLQSKERRDIYVCPSCVNKKELHHLQGGQYVKHCPSCKMAFHFDRRPPVQRSQSTWRIT